VAPNQPTVLEEKYRLKDSKISTNQRLKTLKIKKEGLTTSYWPINKKKLLCLTLASSVSTKWLLFATKHWKV
jgi:hypothetical protein